MYNATHKRKPKATAPRTEAQRVWSQKWYLDNRERVLRDSKAARARNKALVYDHYGRACSCCGETTPEFLTIDHVSGGGNVLRRRYGDIYKKMIRDGFPEDLRTMCFNCNCGRVFNNGICPHLNRLVKTA